MKEINSMYIGFDPNKASHKEVIKPTEEEKEVIANKKVTGCRMSLSKDSCIISIPNEIGIVTDYVFPKKDVQEVLLTVFTNTK